MRYFCCDPRRKNAVEARGDWNGIDFLEVVDNPSDPLPQRQTTLLVHFIHELAAGALTLAHVRIEGGERIRNVRIVEVQAVPTLVPPGSAAGTPPSPQPKILRVRVAAPGDFSRYTLRLVHAADATRAPEGIDRLLASIEFSFKAGCRGEFDCGAASLCPPQPAPAPQLNYLARDYATFRQAMLDRLALTVPQWQERNAADLGIALVELLAYVADRVAYEQDAVATEAYLGTARLRTSVRRHARLVDYAMHDGCNARSFVQLRAAAGVTGLTVHRLQIVAGEPRHTHVLTRCPDLAGRVLQLGSEEHRQALTTRPQVFELLHDVTLHEAHNDLGFYTWGARECCLPRGATRATLRGRLPNLQAGDLLILAEAKSPTTGRAGDRDTNRRHAVKLTRVLATEDPLGGQFADPPHANPVPVTEIEWHGDDALPFALTVAGRSGTVYHEDVALAHGNIVAVDHGMTRAEETLRPVPAANPVLARVGADPGRACEERRAQSVPARYRPRLAAAPVTQACSFDAGQPPAAAAGYLAQRPQDAVAQVSLREAGVSERWSARRDLLSSAAPDRAFVVEAEADGRSMLRFGDDVFGRRPAAGAVFHARYRVGSGTAGNVGAGLSVAESTLFHLASAQPDIVTGTTPPIAAVWNPLPARGGVEPETIESVRQRAPSALRGAPERAVTLADYEALAQRVDASVQRAGASLRWTGSWRTVFLTVDRHGAAEVDAEFERELIAKLERYRLAGHDLEADAPRYVPLELAIDVCVRREHFRADVQAALEAVLSSRLLPDGRRGVFHADNFSFGQPVYLSPIQEAALGVAGVDSIVVRRFRRQGRPETDGAAQGLLRFERLEIARLDNDRNFPDRGALELNLTGGR
jgi:hypothetical protein